MLMLFERLFAVPLIALFFVLAGTLVAPRLGLKTRDLGTLQGLVERAVAGCALLIAVLFVLASINAYRGWALALVATLIVGLGGFQLRSEIRRLDSSPSSTARLPSWMLRLSGLVLFCILAVLWLQSIRPDLSWDANVYHLTLPKLFLEQGGFFAVPFNVYSHWPLGVELLFGLAIAVHDYVLAKQVHFVFGLLTVAVLFAAAKNGTAENKAHPHAARWAGLMACVLFLANPVVLFEIKVAYVDLALALFFLVSFLVAERLLARSSLGSADRRADLLLLGTSSGLVCATKLSGVLLASSLLVVLLGCLLAHRGFRSTLNDALWIAGPLLTLAAPWPLKSWILTGNPGYPLLFKVFGGPNWNDSLAQQHSAWQASIGMGRTPIDYLLLPWRVITQGGNGYDHFDGRLHLAWLIGIPLILVASRTDQTVRRAAIISAIYFAIWAATSQQMRFLIPILALLALAAARSLTVATTVAMRERVLPPATVAVLALLVWAAIPSLRQTPRLATDLAALGYEAKRAVIQPVYDAIDTLPAESKLLLLNTNHPFHINRVAIADSFFEASQITQALAHADSPKAAKQTLGELGVTHVLVEKRVPGNNYPEPLTTLLSDPENIAVTYQDPRFALLRVLP